MLNSSQLAEQLEGLNYILGKISRYRKQNPYVYPRPFSSWQGAYNAIVERLTEAEVFAVSTFELEEGDMSPSGKSLRPEAVERLTRAIGQLVSRLEEKLEALARAEVARPVVSAALARFFPCDEAGHPLVPQVEEQVLLAIRPGPEGTRLLDEGILPVLRTQGIPWASFVPASCDDVRLGEMVRALYASRMVILDLAQPSPQLMFLLGLACALGRDLLLLRPRGGDKLWGAEIAEGLDYASTDQLRAALGEKLRTTWKRRQGNSNPQEVAS